MKKITVMLLALGAAAVALIYSLKTPASPVDGAGSPPADAKPAGPPAAQVAAAKAPSPTMAAAVPAPKAVEPPQAQPAQPAAAAKQKPQPAASPRAELVTIIPELERLIGTQDYETLMQDFMPPDELDALLASAGRPGQPATLAELANNMRANPDMAQKMTVAAQFLAYVATQAPTLDNTGEHASYPIPMPVNGRNTIEFVKIDGNWYVKDSAQFFK